MKILTWNVAALPSKINILGNPLNRLHSMLDKLCYASPNIICLQEVFDFKFQKKLSAELTNLGYQIHTSQPEGIISKNGLLTATLDDIVYEYERDYSMYTGAEYLIKKGILTTHINHKNNKILIHNTHLQSNSIYHMESICTKVRQKQKKEVIQQLKRNIYHLNILCGDLNDDFLTLEHQNFLTNLPFSSITSNPNKIITFPKFKEQLDYIILSDDIECEYEKIETTDDKISDHNILTTTLTSLENQPVLLF